MKKKNEPKIGIAMAVFMALILISVFLGSASANTIYVPDDYLKIQRAVDNATAGSTIIVRDGTYDENVNVNKCLTIQSENGSANCIVQAADSGDDVFSVSANYVNISRFTVKYANGSWKAGIHLNGADYCNISNNNVTTNYFGIYLDYSSNNMVTNNTALNNWKGIYLRYSSNNNISKNNASNNSHGICMQLSNKNTLTNNTANSNALCGISSYKSNDNIIANNTANFNLRNGIYLSHLSRCEIKNNIANWNVKRSGISLENSNDCRLENNIANSNCYSGCAPGFPGSSICLWGLSNCSIINNTANSNCWHGILLVSSSNCELDNNTANSNGYYGIWVYRSSNNTITKSNVSLNTRYGILLEDSSNNTITDNNASNNKRRGIYLYDSSNNTLIGNNVNLNNWDGIYVCSLSNCNMVINNNMSNNDYGIRLENSNNSIIYLNDFINNTDNVYSFNSTNIWNSTSKITYTYNDNTYMNYTGNYWDDYQKKYPCAEEIDGTGIWDTPYSIDSDWDYHPLMAPWENYFKPTEEKIFDTGTPANPYPSIMGNYTGTIKPNPTVVTTKLYTYPCIGTGGHTEYAKIWNLTWNATATWEGYAGDWHNITFDKPVILLANETYNYAIRTGSYPQIHHTDALPTDNGWINCTKFTDANGRIYYDWIPAIRLWA